MASAHVIEVGDVTAGIVVLERGAFRFFASQPAFDGLEGALFRTIDQAARAARDRLRPRRQPIRHPAPSSPGGVGGLAEAALRPSRIRSDWSPA
jgi:hypothetical protein